DNVDIGLMQINWGHWGKRFGLSKTNLLDPWLNVFLGARILQYCVRVGGSWRNGVAPLSFASRSAATGVRREGLGILSPCAREVRKMTDDHYHEKRTSCDGFSGRVLVPRLLDSCLGSGTMIFFSPSLSAPLFMTSG